jgi:Immunity protein 22
MPNDFSSVDIWVGAFPSGEELHEYMAERPEHYADENDSVPISSFAEDMGEWFIDHDFECTMFVAEPTADIKHLLSESLISSDFGPANSSETGETFLAELYQGQNGAPVNSIILVYGDEVAAPMSIEKPGYWLHYLGRFYDSSFER